VIARKHITDAGEPAFDHRCCRDAVARGHATKIESFFDMFFVPSPAIDPGSLLRGIAKHVANLLRI
jgi:hypothetical protein